MQAQYSSSAKEAQSVWTGWTILLIVFLVLAGALWVLDMVAYMRRRGEEPIDIAVSVRLEVLAGSCCTLWANHWRAQLGGSFV